MNLVEKIGKVVTDIVLIDTWWNVNSYILQSSSAHCPVLIDTWWNVNSFIRIQCQMWLMVLIDTWWNVNYFAWELKDKGEQF